MIRKSFLLLLAGVLTLAGLSPAFAQRAPAVVFFDEAAPDAEFYEFSTAAATGGDFLLVRGPGSDRLPVQTGPAPSGSQYALIEYRHGSGSWEVSIGRDGWMPADLAVLDTLVLDLNGPAAISGDELPKIGLEDTEGDRSVLLPLANYLEALDADAGTWQRVAIPLRSFSAFGAYTRAITKAVRFRENGSNANVQSLWVDAVQAVDVDSSQLSFPDPPSDLSLRVGDRSVIVRWKAEEQPDVISYRVYRAEQEGGPYSLAATTAADAKYYVDFAVENGSRYYYQVRAVNSALLESRPSETVTALPRELTDEEFLELNAHTAFDYFWFEANPDNGLVKDRSRDGSAASIAATGFGISAVITGIERGWVSEAEGRERVLTTLRTFYSGPQGTAGQGTIGYKGFFYHFLNMNTATRAGSSELSTVDTALLLGGVLHAREYFAADDSIHAMADSIYRRVDWRWAQVRPPLISHGWHPESGFIPYDWGGYNEAMLVYVLALGSPTHPVGPSAWDAWTRGYDWQTHYGYSFVVFPPLFGHQYSHVWVDFRGIRDLYMRTRGIDYFENSRRATLAQRAYSIANPRGHPNYGPNEWGLTASDVPDGYAARGAPPAQNDEGTIAPTAPGGSVPFAPEETIAALRQMYAAYRTRLWGPYGLRDAYNVRRNWFGSDYIGIDQGPILLMIENHRTGGVWASTMESPYLQEGLRRAGFIRVSTDAEETPGGRPAESAVYPPAPNPFTGAATMRYTLAQPGPVSIRLYDVTGRAVRVIAEGFHPAGSYEARIDGAGLPSGVYVYVFRHGTEVMTGKLVHAR